MATRFSSVAAPVFRICSTMDLQSDKKIMGTSRHRSCQRQLRTAGPRRASATMTRKYTARLKHLDAAAL